MSACVSEYMSECWSEPTGVSMWVQIEQVSV